MNNLRWKLYETLIFCLLLLASAGAFAGFTFGDLTQDGSGNFAQIINKDAFVNVGTIPKGVGTLTIKLVSPSDVDIQVWDVDNNVPVVGWNIGAKIGDTGSVQTAVYNSVSVKYSGYNGDGTGLGNEYITLTGVTANRFLIKAYGFAAGTAAVSYSWKGVAGAVPASGSGKFTTYVSQGSKVQLEGTIPSGASNVLISLSANDDIDVELFDAKTGTFVVGYNGGRISSGTKVSGNYASDLIEWSGWNGRYTDFSNNKLTANSAAELGKEWIKIKGTLTNSYIMKVYGYKSGTATVNYSWGQNIVYAGFLGMGTSYLNSESNSNPAELSFINGMNTSTLVSSWLGHDGYIDSGYKYIGNSTKGQLGIALRLSALTKGGGDISVFSSGNVNWAYWNLKAKIDLAQKAGQTSGSGSKIYVSGHSSGGGDAQDMAWRLKDGGGYFVRILSMIDSAETELANFGDAKIPSNVRFANNYYETEAWYTLFNIENSIYAEDTGLTSIVNKQIVSPVGPVGEDAHERIDNDPRVWLDILDKIIADFVVFLPGFGTI